MNANSLLEAPSFRVGSPQFTCPSCEKRTRILTQHSMGGYITTHFCGHCGQAWQDGEYLNNDKKRSIQFVKENWKHGRTLKIVLDELMKNMGSE